MFPETYELNFYINLLRNSVFKGSREKYRLRVFENRVFRRIFGPKRDEETGDWRKLHNEEFLVLFPKCN
jgi:hypothetical protein